MQRRFTRNPENSSSNFNVQDDLARWNHNWRYHRKRTSDRYILYANGGISHGFLLIAIINDPGAHALWNEQNRAVLALMEGIAEQFCIFGRLPV
jgi:Toxin YafO, type II toxin-antitoxin system